MGWGDKDFRWAVRSAVTPRAVRSGVIPPPNAGVSYLRVCKQGMKRVT